jgi:hypothetical protein
LLFIANLLATRVEACMLGRLRIPRKQAIECYLKLREVFSDKKLLGTSGSAFKASKLKEVLKRIVWEAAGDENARLMGTEPGEDKCKTCGIYPSFC